jgi:1,4-alpha-glucan branching enzyme
MDGFKWIDADNARQSIFSFYREDEKEYLVCVLNMTGASYEDFNLGVPQKGSWSEILNSEKDIYDGCNMCNFEPVKSWTTKEENAKFKDQITVRIAPYAAIWLVCPKRRSTAAGRKEKKGGE